MAVACGSLPIASQLRWHYCHLLVAVAYPGAQCAKEKRQLEPNAAAAITTTNTVNTHRLRGKETDARMPPHLKESWQQSNKPTTLRQAYKGQAHTGYVCGCPRGKKGYDWGTVTDSSAVN